MTERGQELSPQELSLRDLKRLASRELRDASRHAEGTGQGRVKNLSYVSQAAEAIPSVAELLKRGGELPLTKYGVAPLERLVLIENSKKGITLEIQEGDILSWHLGRKYNPGDFKELSGGLVKKFDQQSPKEILKYMSRRVKPGYFSK